MLKDLDCEMCNSDSPKVSEQECADFLKCLPHWQIMIENGTQTLRREFTFHTYQAGLHFTNQVAALAEQENHHPDIVLQWGRVTVIWWTHSIHALHKNDFILAAKTDSVFEH